MGVLSSLVSRASHVDKMSMFTSLQDDLFFIINIIHNNNYYHYYFVECYIQRFTYMYKIFSSLRQILYKYINFNNL